MNRLARRVALLVFLVLGSGAAQAQTSDLLISEYVEGSSTNKAIEIYNGTGSAVNLATGQYRLELYSNGSATASQSTALTAIIADGDVLVLCNALAMSAQCDVASGAVINHNGDDAFVLRKGSASAGSGSVVDSFGQTGFDPGTAWTGGAVTTVDRTLQRKSSVCTGDTNNTNAFDPSVEWDSLAIDTFTGLGSHTASCGSGALTISINDVAQAEGNSGTSNFTFTVSLSSPAPVGGVTFDIATSDGTATTANNDYVAKNTVGATIPAGSSSTTFSVVVNGDTTPEVNESFNVKVTNVVGAVVGTTTSTDGDGLGTIQNDDVTTLPINQIQGSGTSSSYDGMAVVTEGVITVIRTNGFFIQSKAANDDGNPATSEGLWVFTGGAPSATLAVGDVVQVSGTVDEFLPVAYTFPVTELLPSNIVEVGTSTLPTPVELTAADFSAPLLDPDVLERLEGMYVHIASGKIVAPTRSASTDFEIVVAGVQRPVREEGISIFDQFPVPPAKAATIPYFDANQERIKLQPATGSTPLVDARGTVSDIYGALDYAGAASAVNSWKVWYDPAKPGTQIVSGLPQAVTTQGADDVTISGFNLEWYFTDASDGQSGSLAQRRAKIGAVICDWLKTPDILATSEVSDLATLQDLAAYVNGQCPAAPAYEARMLYTGADGTSEQRLGFLISKRIVTGATPRVELVQIQQHNVGTLLKDPNGNDIAGDPLNDRPPLRLKAVVHFADGRQFPVTVIAVHQKSLIGVDSTAAGSNGYATTGDRNRAKRAQQSVELAQLVDDIQTGVIGGNPNEKIVLVGDFNSFDVNDGYVDVMGITTGNPAPDPEVVLYSYSPLSVANGGTPLILGNDLIVDPDERYSYIFNNINQSLDHAVINQALLDDPVVTHIFVDHARVNADFRTSLKSVYWPSYNTTTQLPLASSDHDPVRVTIRLGTPDSTPPEILPQVTGTLGTNGWYTSNVGVTWSVTDDESSVTSSTGCGTSGVYADTAGTGFTCSATSSGGTASNSVTVKRDATAPTIVAYTSALPNGAGWYNKAVPLQFTCADATSGVALCPGKRTYSTEGENQTTFAYRVLDLAGNVSAESNTLELDIDRTRPTVTAAATTAPTGDDGWYTSAPTIDYTCSDALSGVATCPADVVVTGQGAAVLVPVKSGTDVAGNIGVNGLATLKIDTSAPTLSPAFSPALSGGTVVAGTALSISPNAADAQSGIASQSCEPVDTVTLGTKTVTCITTNGAGLVASKTLTYKVVYDVSFSSPLVAGGYFEANVGQPLRVQWQVSDASGGIEGLAAGSSVSFGAAACPAGTPTAIASYEPASTTAVQAMGNGTYWRTMTAPASYAGTCKQIRVASGGRIVNFVVKYN